MSEPFDLVSIRLDSKTKYFSDLLARLQATSFTRLVNDLLKAELAQYEFACDDLWAEHPADRLALLGSRMPQLLNVRQRMLWQRVICLDQMYWLVPLTGGPIKATPSTFNFALLREVWGAVNRNQDAVMELANATMQQLNIKVRRVTHEPVATERE